MKILVGVEAAGNVRVLDWAGRIGYDLRVFAKADKIRKYQHTVATINYDHYTSLDPEKTVVEGDPRAYARLNGYDLLVMLPFNLRRWDRLDDIKMTVYHFAEDCGTARAQFSANESLREYKFPNGLSMIRV